MTKFSSTLIEYIITDHFEASTITDTVSTNDDLATIIVLNFEMFKSKITKFQKNSEKSHFYAAVTSNI